MHGFMRLTGQRIHRLRMEGWQAPAMACTYITPVIAAKAGFFLADVCLTIQCLRHNNH